MSPFTRAIVAALTLFAAIASAHADAPARTAAPAPWSAGFTLEKNGETLQVLDAQGHVVVGGLEGFFPNARYALLLRQSQWGVLRADGHILLAPEYARVEHLPESQLFEVCRDANERCGLVDMDGRIVVPMDNARITGVWVTQTPWVVERDGRSGAFDPATRRWVVPQAQAEIRVGAGMLMVKREPDSPWQVLDRRGAAIAGIPPASDWQVWEEGMRIMGAQGMFDATGKAWVPAGRYDAIAPQGDTAVVSTRTGQGLINAQGRQVLPPRFLLIEPLESAHLGWKRFVEGERWDARRVGVMDAQGLVILPARWDGITLDLADTARGRRNQLIFQVERDERLGVLDAAGNTLFPPRFDSASMIAYGSVMYLVSEDGRQGLCNFASGHCPIPVQFERIQQVDDSEAGQSLFVVTQDTRSALYTEQGQVVMPLQPGLIALSTASDDLHVLELTLTQGSEQRTLRLQVLAGVWQVQAPGHAPAQ